MKVYAACNLHFNFCHRYSKSPPRGWALMSPEAMPFLKPAPPSVCCLCSSTAGRLKASTGAPGMSLAFLLLLLPLTLPAVPCALAVPSSRAPHLSALHFSHQITSKYTVPQQTLSLMKTLPKGIKRWACMFHIVSRVLFLVIYITASEYSTCIFKCHHLQGLFVYCS